MTATESRLPARSDEPGPLSDVTVVELGDERGEYTGLLLAGLGARVIRVEPPSGAASRKIGPYHQDLPGPENSLHFWAYNRGKESIVVDLATAEGVATLRHLLAGADVFLDASELGALEAIHVDPAAYPGLVHARLTPFGEDGPWAAYKTSDLVSLALGGVVMNCGYDPDPSGHYDLPPVGPQAWHSHHIAGEQLMIGVLGALIYRQTAGVGQKVSVAIHEAVAKNTEMDLMSWVMVRRPLYRYTCRHASASITDPSITYTKDGRWMVSMSVGMRDRRSLHPFLDSFGLAAGLEQETGADEVGVRAVAGSTKAATANVEFVQRFTRRFRYSDLPWVDAQRAGLLWVPIRKPHENALDEHWLERGTFEHVSHPEIGREFPYPVSKWLSTAGSWQPGRRAPLLDEHAEPIASAFATGPDARPDGDTSVAADSSAVEKLSAHGKPFPLQGIRILDFGWFLASAGATRFLASLGADVIKVEWFANPDTGRGTLVPEGGREAREAATEPLAEISDRTIGGQFNNKNPGKRGLSLNVRDPRGLEIAKALIAQCDVVTEGFSPGVLEKWGLGYEELRKIRPDVIYVKQSGMGAFGKYGRFRAVGPIAAALSGLSEMSGLPTPAPPAGWGYSFLDWFGAYSMAMSVLASIYHRNATGEGQWIDASQTEVGISLTAVPVLDWFVNGRAWERTGNRSPYQAVAPQGIYRCAGEDRWIAISCFTDEDWRNLVRVAGEPDLLDDERYASLDARIKNHDSLDATIEAWTSSRDAYDLMEALQAVGVAAGVCQSAEDRCDRDPQLRHLDWLTELTGTRIGTWPLAEMPVHMSRTPPHLGGLPNRAAPLYGEDNTSILGELLGMSDDDIAALAADGVL